MASANTPPDPSATFDSLWDFDLPEEDPIPAALAPPQGTPDAGQVPSAQRDTLLPPVPPPEYVQTMMELGELDDPSGGALPRLPPPPPVPGASRGVGGLPLGLVLASESELLLHTDDADAPARGPALQMRGALGSPPMPGRIAGMNRVSGAMASIPRGAPVIQGAPAPRAPSIAPPPPSMRETLEELDLMPFEEAVTAHGVARDEPRAAPPPPPAAPSPPAGNPARRTNPTPVASQRTPPTSGGLRLGKTPPPMAAVEEGGDRITPIASEPPPDSIDNQLRLMQARFESRNYPGALSVAEGILVGNPAHAVARRCAEGCREMMAEKYLSRIGGRNCVPRVAMPSAEIHLLALDHRAGFLLSFIDGSMSVDEVLDVSSMPELDALRIMFELQEQGAIVIEAPARRPARK